MTPELYEYTISDADIIKKLRSRSEPIRLFAETDQQRKNRLRALELKDEKSEGQRNDFMRALDEMESGNLLEQLKEKANFNHDEKLKAKKKLDLLLEYDTTQINLKTLEKSPDKIYTLVYVYFKRMLYEWEEYLNDQHENKLTTAGKLAAATQRQSSEYMKPFFRILKKKTIDHNVIARISEIAMYMQQREYIKANDAYLRLAIGNSPWPIGVTMVGIHERSARENIHASKVAHVLNDETQRKWIQSIKRLMTFAQTKYPPSDLAKRIG
ncbi:hypothetical protein BB561_004369 [Smittium simulii]|uniref:Pre-mRNA-splicing factor 18 n=1 Tax=Smittium simulii TaxID=133385 RepID=A0A2T9YGK5_9FUNG|nr:hypothetical protein BB561_004369 [Smittium simulii]